MSRFPRNIGGVVTSKAALRPVASAAAASFSLVGPVIDRAAFQSALLKLQTGLSTGTPTSFIVSCKVQECDTSGGTYTDVAVGPANPVVATTNITTVSTDRWLELDLSALQQFIRFVFTVSFVGGTSPTIFLAGECILGGGPVLPTAHA